MVREKLTQQDIAERVGASRDMISQLMKDLVAGGYLAIEDRTITILKKLPTGFTVGPRADANFPHRT